LWVEGQSDLLCSEQSADNVPEMSLRTSEEVIENFFLWVFL